MFRYILRNLLFVFVLVVFHTAVVWAQADLTIPSSCTAAGIPAALSDGNATCVVTIDQDINTLTITDPGVWSKLVFMGSGSHSVKYLTLGTGVSLYTIEFAGNPADTAAVVSFDHAYDMQGHKTTFLGGNWKITEPTSGSAIRNSGGRADFSVENAALTLNGVAGTPVIDTAINVSKKNILFRQVSNDQLVMTPIPVVSLKTQTEPANLADGYNTSEYANSIPGFVLDTNVVYTPAKAADGTFAVDQYQVTLTYNNTDGLSYIYDNFGIGNTIYQVKGTDVYLVTASSGNQLSYDWGLPAGARLINGTLPAPQTAAAGAQLTVQVPSDVEVRGLKLIGWSERLGDTVPQYTAGDKVTMSAAANVVLYGVWETQARLTYSANTADAVTGLPADQYGNLGAVLTLNTQFPSRVGFTCLGWGLNAADSTTVLNATLTADPTTVYAVWQPIAAGQAQLIYDANTMDSVNNLPGSQMANLGDTLPLSTQLPTRSGFTCLGWGLTSTDTIPAGSVALTTNPTRVYALWQPVSGTDAVLHYDANTTDAVIGMPADERHPKGTNTTLSTQAPSRTGYTFKGWSLTADGLNQVTSVNLATDTVTVFAIWDTSSPVPTETALLVYSSNTLDPVTDMPASSTETRYSRVMLSGKTPSRPGYSFAGWTLDPAMGFLVTQVQMISDPTTVYAMWRALPADKAEVIYDANTTDSVWKMPSPDLAAKGSTVALSTMIPERNGFTFEGWADAPDGLNIITNVTLATGSVRVYAVWTALPIIPVQLVYDANTVEPVTNLPLPETVNQGYKTILSSQIPERAGYRFMGWTATPNGTRIIREIVPTADPTTVYAKWQPAQSSSNRWFPIFEMFDYGSVPSFDRRTARPNECSGRCLPGTGFPTTPGLKAALRDPNLKMLNYDLMIPVLEIDSEIVLAERSENSWKVSNLGDALGLLEGSALPGEGVSILAGHNHLSSEQVGPFLFIRDLEENDLLFVRDPQGNLTRYLVYANQLLHPGDVESIAQTADVYDNPLVLVTCEDETTEGTYEYRRVVFARPDDSMMD